MSDLSRNCIEMTAARLLDLCIQGQGSAAIENPALPFTRLVKNSAAYDNMPDEEYHYLLSNIEFLSKKLFRDQPQAAADTLLARLLAAVHLPHMYQDSIASIIAQGIRANGTLRNDPLPEPGFEFLASRTVRKVVSAPAAAQAFHSPSEIYSFLSQHIYGQEEAKRAAAMILFQHQRGISRKAVFVGPTGCGKTAIWESLQQIYPNIVIEDASNFSCSGWKGDHKVQDMFRWADPETAAHTIYVLDEADKLMESHLTSTGENVAYSLQNELLKAIEGGRIKIDDKHYLDTSHCSFIFAGSFEKMVEEKSVSQKPGIGFAASAAARPMPPYLQEFTQEDLVLWGGMRREIAGRMDLIVPLKPMTASDFLQILNSACLSPIREMEQLYGRKIALTQESARRLSEEAERSKMGVRYIRSQLTKELDRQMFDDPDAEEYLLFRPVPAMHSQDSNLIQTESPAHQPDQPFYG